MQLSPTFCRQDVNIYLLFSLFTSTLSLANNNNASVLFSIVVKFSSNKLMSPASTRSWCLLFSFQSLPVYIDLPNGIFWNKVERKWQEIPPFFRKFSIQTVSHLCLCVQHYRLYLNTFELLQLVKFVSHARDHRLIPCNTATQNHRLSSIYMTHTWLRGFGGLVVSMLASGTQDRGFDPGEKIHSMPSFGGK